MRGARSTAGFLLIPILSAIAPLLVIPAVTHVHGASGWAALAVAIAVGNASAVVIDLGFGIVGPQQIASDRDAAADRYRRALAARLTAAAVVLPIAAVAAWSLAPSDHLAAVVTTTGIGAAGLGPAWFLTGLGRPWLILLVETAPKCAASAVSAALIWNGAPIVVYGVALCVSVPVTVLLTSRLLPGTAPLPGVASMGQVPVVLREHGILIAGRAVSTTATVLPTVVVGLLAPSAVATFAALDRPLRMGLQVLQAVPARLQAWLGSATEHDRARRIRITVLANVGLGIVAAAVVAFAAPVVLPVLFSDAVPVPVEAVWVGALLAAVVCASRGLGLAVVARERANATSSAAVVIAIVGLVGTGVGLVFGGVTGAFAGLVLAEIAGLLPQARALRR